MLKNVLSRYVTGRYRAALRYYYLRAGVWRASLLDRLRTTSPDDLPLPPASLRFRVSGTADTAIFLHVGRQCADDIRRTLRTLSREIDSFSDILDFGCGCGRVLRSLYSESSARFYGADIDGEAIAWCRSHLPFAEFAQNSIRPPLPFPSGRFDLVYGVSVFTHLDEENQNAWLHELERVTRSGAVLLLTVHGDLTTSGLSPAEIALTRERGLFFKVFQTGRYKPDGLPDFYQSTFHTREYVNQAWSQFFEVVAYLPREMNGHQDIVLLKR
jgi:SAM-dependent methyltransferase